MATATKQPESKKRRPAWLSVPWIAERYGYSRVTVFRWCKSGKLPAKKLGRFWRIRRRDWIAFRDSGCVPAVPSEGVSFARAERLRKARVEKAKAELRAKGV